MPFQKGQSGNPNGRPRRADKHAGAIAKAEQRIAQKLPQLIDNMLALSEGIWVEEKTAEGLRIVYKRAPDRAANEYLINRIMGKPTERKELSGPDNGPIPIQTFDYTAAVAEVTAGSDEDSEAPGADPSAGDG
jgi:hypothetical protein